MNKIIKFDLGRNALRYLVELYKIREMQIPYYLCDVVRHTLVECNCKPKFYHINDNFMPANEFHEDEYILYPNYFGVFRKNTEKLASVYPNLIVDNAHAYFDKPLGFACFNAGHKFGFKDSFLWIKGVNDYVVLNPMEKVKTEYKNNFDNLCREYNGSNLLKINMTDVYPFVYPYLAESETEADKLVKILTQKGITIYRYWNPLPKSFNEYKFYSRLVPIPVLSK